MGFDVIGMTNLPEAKLAREAEIALATLCMVTDYDCWREDEEDVTVKTVLENLRINAQVARDVIAKAVANIPYTPDWPEHDALAPALMTPSELWPEETVDRLRPILSKYMVTS